MQNEIIYSTFNSIRCVIYGTFHIVTHTHTRAMFDPKIFYTTIVVTTYNAHDLYLLPVHESIVEQTERGTIALLYMNYGASTLSSNLLRLHVVYFYLFVILMCQWMGSSRREKKKIEYWVILSTSQITPTSTKRNNTMKSTTIMFGSFLLFNLVSTQNTVRSNTPVLLRSAWSQRKRYAFTLTALHSVRIASMPMPYYYASYAEWKWFFFSFFFEFPRRWIVVVWRSLNRTC